MGNAGTASRFLATVCALVQPAAGLSHTVITGNARMKQRPIGPLVDALTANGTAVEYVESKGCLPLSIKAVAGGFQGGRIQLAASVSSQYVSSILLCAPYATEEVVLELTGGVVISQPYIDLTIAMMETFGISVERLVLDGHLSNTYRIPRGLYVNPSTYNIESDASSATYPLAIAAITGTTCTIENIGSSSLQGDARFAKDVLEPMGCTVVQTATETTVTGPPVGQLRALGYIDMEPMTDAFLTAAALAAVASLPALAGRAQAGQPVNSTRIGGIANQRVKECDRISAMRTQLAKFGVETNELADGIEVLGIRPEQLKPASVHCFDDHRVAMAFSVLGTVPGGSGALLEEKRCVEKTWPSWWDDLVNRIGIKTEGVELQGPSVASTSKDTSDASIFILGMRGAGKTHIGKVGASALEWPVLDADAMFETALGITAKEFVAQNDWPAFRAQETKILKDFLATKATGHVISLGGGVVESAENRALLQAYATGGGPILHLVRDIDDIVAYLDSEPTRPSLGEPLRDIYARRLPWYRALSNYEFVNVIPHAAEASALAGCENEVARFFKFLTGSEKNRVDLASRPTYFLSLTFPSLTAPHPSLDRFDELTAGVDALELRADLLSPSNQLPTTPTIPPLAFVAAQLAALRQRSTLPIVFTVRTQSQGGMFPDDAEDAAFALMELAIKSGCEYVDLECRWSPARMHKLVKAKQSSLIICSWHDWTGRLKWDSEEMLQRYALASKYGDIIKLVSKAESVLDNFALLKFRDTKQDGKPLMTMNMGTEGQLSRILSPVFGPLTSPLMPTRAAPGQLSFAEVQTGLHLLGRLPAKQFALLGSPVSQSKSPLLHNTGFATLGLPHHYSYLETATVDDAVEAFIRSPDFGGASVTIPHKLEIMPLLDEITPHARVIGAVNTIIPFVQNGKTLLRGDNTDWLGLKELVLNNLSGENKITGDSTALVLGAGGTSRAAIYCLHQVGFTTIYLFNRTRENADKMAKTFPSDYNLVVLPSLDSFPGSAPVVVISTIPAAGTATAALPNGDAGVLIPASILARTTGGVVIDAAYKPQRTPLIDLAERTPGWTAVPGMMMLLEQGYHQFSLWTGRRAPVFAMAPAVLA